MNSTSKVRDLFERNATRYDWVNSVISFGLDARWRRWAARHAAETPEAKVLDAFAGTGLVGIKAAKRGASVTLADISPAMLSIAKKRVRGQKVDVKIARVDLTKESFKLGAGSFDAITVVFGIRYLREPRKVLMALSTLLKPDGRLVILEFVRPRPGLISTPAAFYFFNILPRIGSLLAGRSELYHYLVTSTKGFGYAEDLHEIIASAHLQIVKQKVFGFGLVRGVIATRQRSKL